MIRRTLIASLLFLVAAACSPPAPATAQPQTPPTGAVEEAIFAGGCFWGTEDHFQQIAGAVVWHGDKFSQCRAIFQDDFKAHEIVGVGFVGFEFWKFFAGDEKFGAFEGFRRIAISNVFEASNEIILCRLEFCDLKALPGR